MDEIAQARVDADSLLLEMREIDARLGQARLFHPNGTMMTVVEYDAARQQMKTRRGEIESRYREAKEKLNQANRKAYDRGKVAYRAFGYEIVAYPSKRDDDLGALMARLNQLGATGWRVAHIFHATGDWADPTTHFLLERPPEPE
jgi:hypothetical protein